MQVDDLHDAVLEKVTIEVEAGSIEIVLEPVQRQGAAERVVLVARQFDHFVFSRKQPWGLVKSWYVNQVLDSLPSRLQIEMQSGDIIQIQGGTCERIDKQKVAV
jgi:hypothetical protein